jgi:hypothetical protein
MGYFAASSLMGRMAMWVGLCVSACVLVGSPAARASAPADQVLCTSEPQTQWLSESRIREIFGTKDYVSIALKASRTHCYEFYAIRKDGDIVEAYYHPVSGQLMKYSRVSPRPEAIDFSSTLKPHATASKPAVGVPRESAVRH